MAEPPASAPDGFRLRRLWPLAAVVVGLTLVFALDLDSYLSFAALRDKRGALLAYVDAHAGLAAALFVAVYVAATALSVPGGTVLTLAGGFLFGTWLGGCLTAVGATAGATLLFLAAKSSLGDALRARAGPAVRKMEAGFRRNEMSYMLSLRLAPLFPFFVVNIVPAFLGVSLRTFIIATAVGILPATFVYASVGAGLGAVIERGEEPDLGILFEPGIVLPLFALALLSLAPALWRRLRRAR